jgi:chitinase
MTFVDREYPKDSTQAQHYVDLLKALREGLDQHAASKGMTGDRGFELTIAAVHLPSSVV